MGGRSAVGGLFSFVGYCRSTANGASHVDSCEVRVHTLSHKQLLPRKKKKRRKPSIINVEEERSTA